MSYEEISGVKVTGETQGGHFTGISHETSYLEYGGSTFTWEEVGNTVSMDNIRQVSAYTTGKVIYTSTGGYVTISFSISKQFNQLF